MEPPSIQLRGHWGRGEWLPLSPLTGDPEEATLCASLFTQMVASGVDPEPQRLARLMCSQKGTAGEEAGSVPHLMRENEVTSRGRNHSPAHSLACLYTSHPRVGDRLTGSEGLLLFQRILGQFSALMSGSLELPAL